jgi:hypothetical protein
MPFCAKCGKEHIEEDIFCSNCGASLRSRGDMLTEVIDISYPELENPTLELSIPVSGRIEVNPGGEKLVDGTILFDVPEWKPWVTETPDLVRIEQDERWLHAHWNNPKNSWNLNLGTSKPYKLRVRTGVSRAKLSLGGIPLTRFNMSSGVGTCDILFDGENPASMELLNLQAGVGQMIADDILNANPREVRISGGVGEVRLGFTGNRIKEDVQVRLNGGVGGFDVSIAEEVPAVIHVSGLTGVDLRGRIRARRRSFGSGIYETESYTEDQPHLNIRASLGLGGLTLRTV